MLRALPEWVMQMPRAWRRVNHSMAPCPLHSPLPKGWRALPPASGDARLEVASWEAMCPGETVGTSSITLPTLLQDPGKQVRWGQEGHRPASGSGRQSSGQQGLGKQRRGRLDVAAPPPCSVLARGWRVSTHIGSIQNGERWGPGNSGRRRLWVQ